jgi:hypothetical protein
LKVDVFSEIYKILIASSISSVILFFTPKNNFLIIIFSIIISVAAYFVTLYYTRYINQDDINMLKNIKPQS